MIKVFLIQILMTLFFASCTKDPEAPIGKGNKLLVTTTTITSITNNSAKTGGTITSGGVDSVLERGVCWSKTSTNPTVSNSKTTAGSGAGSFVSMLSSLTSNTTYYVRAYAIISSNTIYGSVRVFRTL